MICGGSGLLALVCARNSAKMATCHWRGRPHLALWRTLTADMVQAGGAAAAAAAERGGPRRGGRRAGGRLGGARGVLTAHRAHRRRRHAGRVHDPRRRRRGAASVPAEPIVFVLYVKQKKMSFGIAKKLHFYRKLNRCYPKNNYVCAADASRATCDRSTRLPCTSIA